ncbi:USP6 N-terminal [Brachionus plicatilis]|uniref:USP6 N-terminal n=1 Tax=Brachionus plicatilis TaxID=10195 RepID=A0A3M7P856_BRAPC|nr:USP6 N-terminal [Brachionus plicatilis]
MLPFSLVLRVWDVYLLKGDITILAMSYCILKMHKKTLLQKEFDMDKINEFLNHKLPENFVFSDDLAMQKLNECIEKLLRYKFESSLLEPIPSNELAMLPFGDLKLLDNQHYLNKLAENKSKNGHGDGDRDEQLKKLAKTRLESEKMKREERRIKRMQEKGAKLELNSDSDDSEDDLDSDDDLNPSKLSEYDDDKDIESMISNMTRQSSPHRSINSVDIHATRINSKNSASNSSFTNHQGSDYENLIEQKNSLLNPRASPLKYSSNSLHKSSPKHTKLSLNARPASSSSSALLTHIISPNRQPTSSTSHLNNTATILSMPHTSSTTLTNTLTNTQATSANIAAISTNPDYYSHGMARILSTGKINEYVRSPHGIYTRVNVPPTNYRPNVSCVTAGQNKRTGSLRGLQKSVMQPGELLKKSATGSYNSPTKQNIQNHSLRIASIQQQNEMKSSFKNYSIIAQGPSLLPQVNKLDVSSGAPKTISQAKDLVEQCDYI